MSERSNDGFNVFDVLKNAPLSQGGKSINELNGMPQLLIISGEHIGIFTTSTAASEYANDKWPDRCYQIVDINLFYATDFGDKK